MNPNTFVIGAPKSGTTSLAAYLAEHPRVFFSNPKEPLYWCYDFREELNSHEPSYDSINPYLRLFSSASPGTHSIVAEGSTRYLHSKDAVPAIVEFNPDAKFIVMLRNPVDFVYSYHSEQCYQLYENEPNFEAAWRREGNAPQSECSLLSYRGSAKFGNQLKHILKYVRRENLLVVFFDDLCVDARAVYENVLEFLELDSDHRAEFPILNSSHHHRFEMLARVVLTPPAFFGPVVLRMRQHLNRQRYAPVEAIKSWLNVKRKRKKMSAELRLELASYFREDVELLSTLTSRDLDCWIPREAAAARPDSEASNALE